jgi:hypothetical protein
MPAHLVQKMHPALQLGGFPRIASRERLFSQQSMWDSGCVLHATAMALALLGLIEEPAVLRWSRKARETKYWRIAEPYYLVGVELSELIDIVARLNWGVRTELLEASHRTVLSFCEFNLKQGQLLVVSWRPVATDFHHAALAVGIEGRTEGSRFTPHALLIIDPAENSPVMTGYNGRLVYGGNAAKRPIRHALYVTDTGETRQVVLGGAVAIRPPIKRPARNSKPP